MRDVVWTMNTGRGSDELIFDDYVNPDTFIFSEMSASMSFAGGPIPGEFAYHDGFTRLSPTDGAGFSGPSPVRVQNAATAPRSRWIVPRFGLVRGGARLEPAALGGIRAKGLWLDGTDDALEYQIAAQPTDPRSRPWFIGVFVDLRMADDANARRLFTFPDGTRIDLLGRSEVQYLDDTGSVAARIRLPRPLPTHGFSHLSFVVDPAGDRVVFYLDGYRYHRWMAGGQTRLFRIGEGTLMVGGSGGIRGWVDEVKVIAERPNPEVICNHARGTLLGLTARYDGPLTEVAERYDAGETEELNARLAPRSFPNLVCFHDYADERANLRRPPPETVSVREALLFGEGPLSFDEPRPSSVDNPFCRSCHFAGFPAGLGLDALTFDAEIPMERDRRRQPMQPPRLVFGHVPSGFVPPTGLPETPQIAPPGGLPLDRWLRP